MYKNILYIIYIDCDPHNKSHLNENFQPDVNERQTRTHTHNQPNINTQTKRSLGFYMTKVTTVPRSKVI